MPGWTFYRNMPVYLRSGKLLGHMIEISHAADFLLVQQGRRFIKDWYIPTESIKSVDAHGVHLAADLSELRRDRRNVPTDDFLLEQGATVGYEHVTVLEPSVPARLLNPAAALEGEETHSG